MTETAFRVFPEAGVVALFDEAPGEGDPTSILSLRNRPALEPENWLTHVYFHTSLDNMEVAASQFVTIHHAEVPVATAGDSGPAIAPANGNYDFDAGAVDHEVLTHDLGYPPLALVAVGGNLISPGYPVQVPLTPDGSGRFVSLYVTTTKVFIREFRSRGAAPLAAISLNYEVIVFRAAPAPSGDKAMEFDPVTGRLTLAQNRFDSSRAYLQVVPGGTPFGLITGRSMDAGGGGYRVIRADGTWFDPVPSTAQQAVRVTGTAFVDDTGWSYGPASTYDGDFTGSETIEVQVP